MWSSSRRVRAVLVACAAVLTVAAGAISSRTLGQRAERRVGSMATTAERRALGQLGPIFLLPPTGGRLRIYESTFNEFAAAVGTLRHEETPPPLRVTYHLWSFKKWKWTRHHITICSGVARSEASNLRFDIHENAIDVGGDVVTRWCGQRVHSDLQGQAVVSLHPSGESLSVTAVTRPVNPRFVITLPDWLGGDRIEWPMPFTISAGPSLTQHAIPVRQGSLSFQTARGPRTLTVDSRDLSLRQDEGWVEIGAKVLLW